MLLLLLLAACGAAPDLGDGGPREDCAYPAGAVEPMALDEVLWPYAWPAALHADGSAIALDLARVACPVDPVDMAWSAFDLLLFVSIPAW